jgi:O-antigen/teichoic acid export membrane protein
MINGGSIFAGEVSARLATFLVAVVVARGFGPVALGQYGYAVAVASVLLLVPDSGLHLFIVRELAAAPERLRPVFWGVHWLKLPLLAIVLSFSLLFGPLAIHDRGRRLLLYVLVAKVALQTFSQAYMAVFKAFERMHFVAVQQFANAFLTAVCVGASFLVHASLTVVVLALLAGQALETWIGWRIVRSVFSPGSPCRWDGSSLRLMLFAGAPIGIAAILQALNLRLDILTLSPFASNRVLGNYQAAAWFPVGAFLFVSLLMTTLFPKVARLLRNPGKQRNDYIESLLKNGVLLMTVGSIVVGLLAPYLLRVLFGGRLVSAVSALRILVLALPCIFINTTLFYLFVAAQRRSAYLTALLLGVFAGGALSVVLSARYGPNGTALAYVLREFFVSVVYLCFLKAGDFAQSAGRALLRILACATALIVLVILLANSTIFGAAWSLALVAGTVIFMGRPRLQEMLLLVDDDL